MTKIGAKLLHASGRFEESLHDLSLVPSDPSYIADINQTYIKNLLELKQVDELVNCLGQLGLGLPKNLESEITSSLNEYSKLNINLERKKLDHEEMKRHYKFIRWLKGQNAKLRKTTLRMYDKGYRGLHAAKNINTYEEILSIPADLTISCKTLENETEIGKKLTEANVFDNKWKRFIFPLIYVLKELYNENSRYKDWLDIIPTKADTHPMFFDETERNWLKGSTTLDQLADDLKMIESFYHKICQVDPSFGTNHPFTQFAHYYYILCSRYFGVQIFNSRATLLVPYADLINTGTLYERNASWEFDASANEFKIRCLLPIKAGEPILFSYGHNSNFTYFTYYGFVLDQEEFDSVCLMLRFETSIPNYILKAALLNQETTMCKKVRFYQDFRARNSSNMSFMSKCRFYWTGAKPEALVWVHFNKNKLKIARITSSSKCRAL